MITASSLSLSLARYVLYFLCVCVCQSHNSELTSLNDSLTGSVAWMRIFFGVWDLKRESQHTSTHQKVVNLQSIFVSRAIDFNVKNSYFTSPCHIYSLHSEMRWCYIEHYFACLYFLFDIFAWLFLRQNFFPSISFGRIEVSRDEIQWRQKM